ncbi:hypothetical protein L915_18190 [Phytophthora nicotianae]|uniref:Uncharacterized protein n=1 Tax=Phytophthora nicotianae TaxID=4792 RepID=W2FYW8_PHYNI|nr:hypothetical protein L915_18190 [Phytophthora nicotianae]
MDGSTLRVDDAASGAGGCKHPALETLACSRTAGLHEETECNQAGLDHSCPRIESGDGYNNGNPSRVGLSVEQVKTSEKASSVERRASSVEMLNVLTRTCTGFQYRSMSLENPPTSASGLTSLPAMGWMRFAKDLFDGHIEQICILSDIERMKSEAEELRVERTPRCEYN